MDVLFEAKKSALVLIDLQRGITGMPTQPRPAAEVLTTCAALAAAVRSAGGLVVRVRVNFGPDRTLGLTQPVDQPMGNRAMPDGFDELCTEVPIDPADVVITKHQWGAFYGTELDLILRRRGRDTILLGGISTNIGVESTARDAYERGYSLVLIEDAMASMSADAHKFAVTTIFPRLGRVRTAAAITEHLATAGSA